MANELGVVKVILDGFVGAPGLMQLRFQGGTPGVFSQADATAAIAAVRAFLDAIKSGVQGGVGMYVQSDVEVIDWTTGDLQSVVSGTGVTLVLGTGTTNALVAMGPLVQWRTSTVVGKRMLRGRTFIVPSSSSAIGVSGLVTAAVITALSNGGSALIATAAVTLSIWHRPNPLADAPVGTVGAVVSCTVPPKVSVLRSRRD